jgi:hypothetical protein
MNGNFTIRMGMSGSGARMNGTMIIVAARRQQMGKPGLLKVMSRPRTGSCAAVVGSATLSTAARRSATGTRRAAATVASASASRGLYRRPFYPPGVTEKAVDGIKGGRAEVGSGRGGSRPRTTRRGRPGRPRRISPIDPRERGRCVRSGSMRRSFRTPEWSPRTPRGCPLGWYAPPRRGGI